MQPLAPTSPPLRLIARRMTDFFVRGTAALAEPHRGDLTQTLAFTTIACATLSHLPYGSSAAARAAHGLDRTEERLRRPLSVNAVARSLGLPFETVRLRTLRLEALGFCERTTGGVFVPASAMPGPAVSLAWMAAYERLRENLDLLQAAGVDLESLVPPPEDAPPAQEPPPLVAMRIVLDSVLRFMERSTGAFGTLSRGYLFAAVAAANTRHLDASPYDPLAFAYADTPPPDALRRPVSIRGMARELGLPVETTRRNAERLTAEGWFTTGAGGGLIVPAAALEQPLVMQLHQAIGLHTFRMLVELRRAGVRIDDLDRDATGYGAQRMAAEHPVC